MIAEPQVAAQETSVQLKLVVLPGRKRIHMLLAVIPKHGYKDLWVDTVTACGKPAPTDYGMPEPSWGRQECGACRAAWHTLWERIPVEFRPEPGA